ncbi:MAG: NADAR family protein [Clostridia bacterium]|nr:NADAR family protein [Clostridia bacterium]
MKYDVNTVRAMYRAGEMPEVILFWGHTTTPGKIRKSCFSQWYDCCFTLDGVRYHTTEQYMMAQKALLFGDENAYQAIMAADSPKDYKALGRTVGNFDPAVWDGKKYGIVLRGNLAKFSQNEPIKAFLLGTEDKIIAEASPYDGIWGIRMAIDDPNAGNPEYWGGENLLGFALMETRDLLREQEKEAAECP